MAAKCANIATPYFLETLICRDLGWNISYTDYCRIVYEISEILGVVWIIFD
jgi:hypothetical protein